ncbi:hypothetical protein EDB81DRAFT_642364 [Dactylonectria macrodidyma]|uniref:J domain-containing protein n=1 Tax=Dactylonectria macrodidyma TaxID=307937 RepID=A0A9P9FG01_9HYPO|nr:hypothetical protein EDB81DRAFT_642364 [Dactylonectria macrodidyma]
MATSRDYYADLGLPPSADVQEIKKQFRKLALKYHPDRNPGREQEVNVQFQVIQSAHEVLSDPEQKAKYDATRTRSRYPGASGVKGNPWANAGDAFPPPPRRNQPNRPAPSGAQRWQNRFSQGVPPTAKQYTTADHEAKKNAAKAFENMRKGPSQASAKPAEQPRPTPPPPPPRTESARQRAQASFGSRRAGYHPRSAMHGDEPPVTSSNYTSRPAPERFAPDGPNPGRPGPMPMPDPLSQFRDRDSSADTRQSTPYSKHGGEKTNPFDGVPLGRTKSTRETSRQDAPSPDIDTPTRQRSFTDRPKGTNDEEPKWDFPTGGKPPPVNMESRPKAPLKKSRSSQKPASASAAPNGAAQPPNPPTVETPSKTQSNTTGGPSMYETPPCSHNTHLSSSFSNCNTCRTYNPHRPLQGWTATHQDDVACTFDSEEDPPFNSTPSGDRDSSLLLTAFERQQQRVLARLIENAAFVGSSEKRKQSDQNPEPPVFLNSADNKATNSFSFPVNDDTFSQTSPQHKTFSRSNTDDINTSFVDDQDADSWQFSAGGSEQGTPTRPRPQSGNRTGRHSPTKRPTVNRTDTSSVPSESGTSEPGFNPDGWNNEFGPHTFVPQPSPVKTTSPTRSMRGNPKKPKPKAAGVSPIVIDSSSEEEDDLPWRGRKPQGGPVAADSPQAMDIDSPPTSTAVPEVTAAAAAAVPPAPPSFNAAQPPTGARNINVEPSRPEWRPGNVEGVNGGIKKPAENQTKEFNPNAAGSEDSEEFRVNFADLKNVAPFTHPDSGLRSFTELKDNLPFESKASANIPFEPHKPDKLVFPTPPKAPNLPSHVAINGMEPSVASWDKYVKEFEQYLKDWDVFNASVVDHFSTRKRNISHMRKAHGYSFLEAHSDAHIQEYFDWLQQDSDVQKRWTAACEEHQHRFRDFMAFRMKMK